MKTHQQPNMKLSGLCVGRYHFWINYTARPALGAEAGISLPILVFGGDPAGCA